MHTINSFVDYCGMRKNIYLSISIESWVRRLVSRTSFGDNISSAMYTFKHNCVFRFPIFNRGPIYALNVVTVIRLPFVLPSTLPHTQNPPDHPPPNWTATQTLYLDATFRSFKYGFDLSSLIEPPPMKRHFPVGPEAHNGAFWVIVSGDALQ